MCLNTIGQMPSRFVLADARPLMHALCCCVPLTGCGLPFSRDGWMAAPLLGFYRTEEEVVGPS